MIHRIQSIFLRGLALFCLALLAAPLSAAAPGDGVWRDSQQDELRALGARQIVPMSYRAVALDRAELEHLLSAAPMEKSAEARSTQTVISLPLPDGSFGRFHVEASPIMAPALAAKFPEIKTYHGQGIDDPTASVRFDTTPVGFHAMILSGSGTIYIDPYSADDTTHHVTYYKRDFVGREDVSFECQVREKPSRGRSSGADRTGDQGGGRHTYALQPAGAELREYRTAVAATGEYTAFHGGTVAAGLAAIVTAMNRVNGIYQREVAIRMTLVPDNDQIVYTDGATDPYTNLDGVAMLSENQSNVNRVIGRKNYDIGHVFSTGGGGVAYLGVTCDSNYKARGVTGLSSPVGDPFYVDYVAHEMGHQWGGNHSFNGSEGSCSGGNRNGATAYEPGSGSTIMAYAGICGSQDLQDNSDDYFHGISFDEIVDFSTNGGGNGCAVTTTTGNSAPIVNAGSTTTIPIETPFTICGSAFDPDTDPLTYNWEQFNLGPAGHPDFPSGDAPIFRSWDPLTEPCRTFPRLSDLVNSVTVIGEQLPTYTRTLTFRLTARDNRVGGGGVDFDQVDIDASDLAGPFRLTNPDTTPLNWQRGATEIVTWAVAGTDLPPVNCANVDILLGIDGGFTYPHTLATGTPNDGSEPITVPAVGTTTARVKVQCSDNIFFDISNVNTTITLPPLGAAGQIPDGNTVPGTPLTVTDAGGGDITLTWDPSCSASDSDYEVYEGTVGNYTSHESIFCSTGGLTTITFTPVAGSSYYLVVPRTNLREGSYGQDSTGAERPQGSGACLDQLILDTCP